MSVSHKADEYVRGDVYTNTIEGYFSIFKRGMKGVYQHCDESICTAILRSSISAITIVRVLASMTESALQRLRLGLPESA